MRNKERKREQWNVCMQFLITENSINLQFTTSCAVNKIDSRRALCKGETHSGVCARKRQNQNLD